jgi:hypothetical protein
MLRKAAPVLAETDIHPPLHLPEMVLSHLSLFQQDDVASALAGVTKLLPKVSKQKFLTQWYRETSPTRQELVRLRAAYPSLDTHLTHLFPIQYTGPRKPLTREVGILLTHLVVIIHHTEAQALKFRFESELHKVMGSFMCSASVLFTVMILAAGLTHGGFQESWFRQAKKQIQIQRHLVPRHAVLLYRQCHARVF